MRNWLAMCLAVLVILAISLGLAANELAVALATAGPFLRMPLLEKREVRYPDGNVGQVPLFTVLDINQISHYYHVEGDGAMSHTRVHMRSGQQLNLRIYEDELTYVLSQVAGQQLVLYHYKDHQEARKRFRRALSGRENLPTRQPSRYQEQDDPREQSPTEVSRVGPGNWCGFGNHQIEDGQKAILDPDTGDTICLECSNQIHEEVNEEQRAREQAEREAREAAAANGQVP